MTQWSRPVEWPEAVERTVVRDESRFKKRSFSTAIRMVVEELDRFRARKIRATANVATGSARGCLDFNGVAVTFELRDRSIGEWIGHAIACDNYPYASDNAVAIAKTVEALRAVERHGSSQLAAMAMSGFRALPPGADSGPKHRHWREVLDVPGSGLTTNQQITLAKASFRELQKTLHPDHGGSPAAFEELTGAWASAKRDLGA